ncbi:MAG: phosphotransferase, partial [Actinobacteria bacterium]|nr:phosphotransferase [Actinomycetota bacterium]
MTDFNEIAALYARRKSIQELFGTKNISVKFLAQGEYNVNFLLSSAKLQAVLRLNTGSQMHLENQIAYEFRTLEILQNTGVTPRPLYLDDSRKISPHGMLVMEYLPGRWLEYENDYLKAVGIFAKIHSVKYFPNSGLVAADKPASAILKECKT